jgi:hypothetical protein
MWWPTLACGWAGFNASVTKTVMGAEGGKGHPAKKAQAGSNERLFGEEKLGWEDERIVVDERILRKEGQVGDRD